MTIRQTLNAAEAALQAAGVPDARLDAEYLLAEVLDAPRLALRLRGGDALTDAQQAAFLALLRRREAREPLQYIQGTQEFMGLTFQVCPDVLIPRADTETLVEQALKHIRPGMRVLDVCTGSGAIAVAIKKLAPQTEVSATDLSEKALAVARRNATAQGAEIIFYQGDFLQPVAGQKFGIIVSNPPYIPAAELPLLQAEVQREPRMALEGGADGLLFYRRLAAEAPAHLLPGGQVLCEIGDTQFDAVRALFGPQFTDIALVHDLSGLPRVICAKWKG